MERIVAERQCAKIIVTGTHSTGKSTLVSSLAAQYGLPPADVVSESARDCPFALNLKQNVLSTTWLIANQIKLEIDAQTRPGATLAVCDRGLPDIFAYHRAAQLTSDLNSWMAELRAEWLSTYDLILVSRPDPRLEAVPDALRLKNDSLRHDVQQYIEEQVIDCGTPHAILPHDPTERLASVRALLTKQGICQ